MRNFLRNNLSFPARSPVLNRAHPFMTNIAGSTTMFAAVANLSGGMTDLTSGIVTTNAATLSEVNENGTMVRGGNAVNSSTFLSLAGPDVACNVIRLSMIMKYTSTGQQWLMGFDMANSGLEVVTTSNNLNWRQSNVNVFGNYTLQLNHTYYIIVINRASGFGGLGYMLVLDMTTGLIWVSSTTSGLGFGSAQQLVTLLQLNDANTGATSRIAAASLSYSSLGASHTPVPLMDLGTLCAMAADPWSLWYA
jgi:hypothetical protein